MIRFLPLASLLLTSCSMDSCGRGAATLVPLVGKLNPAYDVPAIDCGEPYPTRPMTGCMIELLECGSVVEDNTAANSHKQWGDLFYDQQKCTGQKANYDASPEAVYKLIVPPNRLAEIRLDSDCADLDLVGVSWKDENQCPHKDHTSIPQCDMDVSPGGGTLRLTATDRPVHYLIGVDGKNGASGNFRLSVNCFLGR